MAIRSKRSSKSFAVAVLIVGCATVAAQAHITIPPQAAAPLVERSPKATPKTADNAAELGLLTSAYDVLAVADHDYKGHRLHAMKAIELACAAMGSDISGRGKGREPQPTSDAQIAAARSSVQQALSMATSQNQRRVVFHLTHAVNDLNEALATK